MPSFFPAAQQQAGTTRQLLREPDGSVVRRTVLPNGLRVLSESIPGVRSATIGVWAGVGSRDETPASAGAAHFLEHLLFKGTTRRSALDIAAEIDAVGGQANAFTSKEYTCFYAKVLGTDLPVAVDVILDITTRPTLRETDIDAERTVVVEEIAMHDDDPGDRAGEALESAVLGASPLAKPILGTRDSITGMSPRTIRSFFSRHYRPERLAVAVAGNVDHAALVRAVRDATSGLDWPWGVAPAPLSRSTSGRRRKGSAGGLTALPWPGEQCTVALGMPGLPRSHPDRRTLDVLSDILGGGMSSRFFQTIREERGLAYSVYAGHSPYSDAGVWSAAAGCQPENVVEVMGLISGGLRAAVASGITEGEVARAKAHLTGSMVLGNEDTSSRMVTLGRAEVVTGELIGLDEAIARIDAVTVADVNRVAHEIFAAPARGCVVGPTLRAPQKRALQHALTGAAA